jgi:hypothetical protein
MLRLSILNFEEEDKKKILKILQIADSIHDFKGERSETDLNSITPLKEGAQTYSITPSTVEHKAEVILTQNITNHKLDLVKLINNNEYKYEIEINNELNLKEMNDSCNLASSTAKELKIKLYFDRLSHGNKLRNKKYFTKSVFDFFKEKYISVFGSTNNKYLVDAVNIPISNFLSSNNQHNVIYTQIIEESNKWDMAPTSTPIELKDNCIKITPPSIKTNWIADFNEKIVTDRDGAITTIYNKTDISNISVMDIIIKTQIVFESFLGDENYKFVLLNQTDITLPNFSEIYCIPILTENLYCFTAKINNQDNCYGYIVFMTHDKKKLCIFSSNAYRKMQDNPIGVSTLSSQFVNPDQNIKDITKHLGCKIDTFILDIKRTGDWSQIIQINNHYKSNNITFISHDNLAILFAKLINIPYIHTSTSEHFVSFNMRNPEISKPPSDNDIASNLITKITNYIDKYNIYLDESFFKEFIKIKNHFKTIFIDKINSKNNFYKNILKFMYIVIENIYIQHASNIKDFYKYQELFEKTNTEKDIKKKIIDLNEIYSVIEKLILLIQNFNNEITINRNDITLIEKFATSTVIDFKITIIEIKKILLNIKIMKGNMDLAKSFIFLLNKLYDLDNISPSSSDRIAIKNAKLKNDLYIDIYNQIFSIINKIKFYKGDELLVKPEYFLKKKNDDLINDINDMIKKFNELPLPVINITNNKGNPLTQQGGLYGYISIVITIGALGFLRKYMLKKKSEINVQLKTQNQWKEKAETAFQSDKYNNVIPVKTLKLSHKLNFYYNTHNKDEPVNFSSSPYSNMTKKVMEDMLEVHYSKNQAYILRYNIQNFEYAKIIDQVSSIADFDVNNMHIIAQKFYELIIKNIFTQKINEILKLFNIKNIAINIKNDDKITLEDMSRFRLYSESIFLKKNNTNTGISIKEPDGIEQIYKNELDYLCSLPMYELKKPQMKSARLNIEYEYQDRQIDNNQYIYNIFDMILSDNTYRELLAQTRFNILKTKTPRSTKEKDIDNKYLEWYKQYLILIDIFKSIKDNRVITFNIADTVEGGGYNNNFICQENLKQIYSSLKYLVLSRNDIMYNENAIIFKNICYFFEIDIPVKIQITNSSNLNELIIFINKIFVNRYLSKRQETIENSIYAEWEREDISNFHRYYDIYTNIKDYQNIIDEIEELMINETYDLDYCINELVRSVESLYSFIEKFFIFKYDNQTILSHVGNVVNTNVYLTNITNNTLLDDKSNMYLNKPKIDIDVLIMNIEKDQIDMTTIDKFIKYIDIEEFDLSPENQSKIRNFITHNYEHKNIYDNTNPSDGYPTQISVFGGSKLSKKKYMTKKQSRHKN